jgi:hypothetical protein
MAEGIASMSKFTPYIIAACVVAYLAIDFASAEYANIRNAIGQTKAKTDAVADETKATMEAIKQTIEDLRAKFRLLETQMQAKATEEKPEPKPVVAPKIVMHSASWCGPCQRWKREAMPQWKSIGWAVDIIEDDATTQTVPWFEITDSDGMRFKSVGYLTRETFDRDKLLQRNLKATK